MPALETLVQWLALLAQSALFGGLCFDAICLRDPAARGLAAATDASRNQFNKAAIVACVLAAFLAMLAPPRELSAIARWGVGAARLIGLLAVFGLIRAGRVGSVVIASGALLALQIPSSRIAILPDAAIPLIADLLHFSAAAVWLGGVARLGLTLAPAAARGPELIGGVGAAIRRFSPLAMASVLVLALTGLAQANLVIGDLDALLGTGYGRTLLLKIVLFAGLIGLGALHQMTLAPRLATLRGRMGADAPAALGLIRRTLLIELGAGAAILGAAAILVAWQVP
ncbi:MAG TPA: CopD family protein [Thermoflexales bacterium]|nr:CopD family protein [Thermoflexales bacterium]HQZ53397.1 CopD family protein [Thermoflexales bacterium]